MQPYIATCTTCLKTFLKEFEDSNLMDRVQISYVYSIRLFFYFLNTFFTFSMISVRRSKNPRKATWHMQAADERIRIV